MRGRVGGRDGEREGVGMETHWRHVVRCSHKCFSKTEVMMEDSGQTKVPQLHIVVAIEKHISWFQVTMKNLQRKKEGRKGGREGRSEGGGVRVGRQRGIEFEAFLLRTHLVNSSSFPVALSQG